MPDLTTNPSYSPIILINDPSLRELYNLVGVEELTASTSVRKFILQQSGVSENRGRFDPRAILCAGTLLGRQVC